MKSATEPRVRNMRKSFTKGSFAQGREIKAEESSIGKKKQTSYLVWNKCE